MRRSLAVACALLAVLAAGCSSKGKVREPAKLQDIETVAVSPDRLWSASAGNGAGGQRSGLGLSVQADTVYGADSKGRVYAFARDSGKRLWRVDTDARVIAGPGVSGDAVLVGTLDAEVIALARTDGHELWRSTVSSEVLAPPTGDGSVVVARSVDGYVAGLSATDGKQLWSFDRSVPSLTLRGLAPPVIVGNAVLIGMDNGRVAALNLQTGDAIWEQVVATPSGRTELERITDVDADLLPTIGGVYAVSFGGELAAINAVTGEVEWRRSIKSYSGIAQGDGRIFVSDEEGVVWALDAATGAAAWKQEGLRYRGLSAPAVQGDFVVVADYKGYLHYLDRSDGREVGRSRPLSAPVEASPQVIDGVLYANDTSGRVVAVEARPR